MRSIVGIIAVLAIAVGGYYVFTTNPFGSADMASSTASANASTTPEVVPIEHATAVIRWGDSTIYLDPLGGAEAFVDYPAADIVLVTDIHSDHLSTSTLSSVVGGATLIVPEAVKEQLPADLATRATVMKNDETVRESKTGISVTAHPMYNLPDASNSNYHTKGRGNGYVLEKDGFRIYIAGDTAGTPEMRALKDIDIAFIPMNLPYTMTVDEAADAVLAFKPKTVYPYHYRGTDGLSDVGRFKQLVNDADPRITVVLADWYPNQ